MALVETIHAVALQDPEVLRPMARSAFFFPSFRARPSNFTHDFPRIAEDVELSGDTILSVTSKTKQEFDSPPTRIVLLFLQRMAVSQAQLRRAVAWFNSVHLTDPKRTMSLEEYLIQKRRFQKKDLLLLDLPVLTKASARDWWKRVIVPYLDSDEILTAIVGTPFYKSLQTAGLARLKQNRTRNSRRSNAVSDSTIKSELKEACRRSFFRIAELEYPAVPKRTGKTTAGWSEDLRHILT